MDLPWGDERSIQFVTNVGLVTSDGPFGPNVSSAEWTHHVSYKPGLIMVCIKPSEATHENIAVGKEFGIHLAAEDQNVIASVAGNTSAKKMNKIPLLQELGCVFRKAAHIKPPMLEGAVLSLECKLVEQRSMGTHTQFIGEVVEAAVTPGKAPLVYHGGKYWRLGDQIHKPPQEEFDRIKTLAAKYEKVIS